jgi:hypothetical protein
MEEAMRTMKDASQMPGREIPDEDEEIIEEEPILG